MHDAPADYFALDNDALISRLMEDEAIGLGMTVERLSKRVICCERGDTRLVFYRSCSHGSSYTAKLICDNKEHTKRFLQKAGLATAPYRVFDPDEVEAGLAYADSLGGPVVVKPCLGSRGRGVSIDLATREERRLAWRRAVASRKARQQSRIMVERHVRGLDFRFFMVGDEVVGAFRREPALVIGDGRATVADLIEAKNSERRRNPALQSRLILPDNEMADLLQSQGYELGSVPANNVLVQLRLIANVSAGGQAIDVTDEVHPGFNDVAVRTLRAIPGLEHGACDILAEDISRPPQPGTYAVIEAEFDPGMTSHHFPARGRPRNIARAILMHYLGRSAGAQTATP